MTKIVVYFLAVAMGLMSLAALGQTQTAEYKIDVYTPVIGLVDRLEKLGPLNLGKLISAVTKALGCLTNVGGENLIQLIEADLQKLPEVRLKLPDELIEAIKNYTKTPDFAEIHNFLWKEGSEWNDFIYFLYDKGFNEEANPGKKADIYEFFRRQYNDFEVPEELKDTLPTGPPTPAVLSMRAKRSRSKRSPVFPELSSVILETCSVQQWTEILKELQESQTIEWLSFTRLVLKEINTNPSVHALWAKFTEHGKGEEFRAFRSLRSVKLIIDTLDRGIKNNELFKMVIDILSALTGINFEELNINIMSNLVSLFEYFVWRTPFPLPDP